MLHALNLNADLCIVKLHGNRLLFVNQLIVLVVQQNCQVGCSQHNGLTLVGNGDVTLRNNLGAVHELDGNILDYGSMLHALNQNADLCIVKLHSDRLLFVIQLIVLVVQQNCQVGCSQHNGITRIGNSDITLLNNLGAVHELDGNILNLGDSSGLLFPCSDINSGCTHCLLHSRSPASEVIALTSNITLECRSPITAAQILVNLIGKDFRSFHAIGVGYGKVTRLTGYLDRPGYLSVKPPCFRIIKGRRILAKSIIIGNDNLSGSRLMWSHIYLKAVSVVPYTVFPLSGGDFIHRYNVIILGHCFSITVCHCIVLVISNTQSRHHSKIPSVSNLKSRRTGSRVLKTYIFALDFCSRSRRIPVPCLSKSRCRH